LNLRHLKDQEHQFFAAEQVYVLLETAVVETVPQRSSGIVLEFLDIAAAIGFDPGEFVRALGMSDAPWRAKGER
jgi:hypothetical protein